MVFHCALNAMFALACHFSDLPSAEREPASDMFFQKSKTFLGIALIEHNSLSVVQALLIVSLYLQSTAFPNRCWNSVGIACRLAQGVGLHIDDEDGKGGSLEAEVRRRTWYCCVILDMNVSMTFGRPPMTSTIPDFRSATSYLGWNENVHFERSTEDEDVRFFVEMFRLSQILEEILRTIYQYQPWRDKHQRDSHYGIGRCGDGHHGRLDSTIQLDAHLSRFEQYLPHFLSWTGGYDNARPQPTANHAPSHFQMQKNVLHGRFLYVRLMLYRPFLSQFWSSVNHAMTHPTQNGAGASSSLLNRGFSSLIQSSFASECCKHCVAYSMQLVSLTHESFLTHHTTSWWWNALYSFTCGFVFILALSCPPVRSLLDIGAVVQSWQKCQTILASISTTSFSVQKSLHLLRRLYEGMVTCSIVNASDIDNVPATSQPVDAANEAGELGMNGDNFTSINSTFAETIDTDMIEALFNSLGSGVGFGDDAIS
ncbi:Transcription factor [Cordyceps fumosorosea ARSEF 2679]|uniref:Transcription factor n=1 Tax=Cordyceps fumosorosea (strain ARSEF 2679) TaxID=1081104 RepID=A0A167LMA0_CORFA|nr:Transcription factor [Cordyceps fumosorosea ARSEF 2679]OAA53254.1 Transcription factor [Cordyceps fumosorosea ARSEF 2679]